MAMLGKRRVPRERRANERGVPRSSRPTTDEALLIERLAHDGRGVARSAEGKTVFVEAALPGERVEVAIHRQRRRFDEAHVRQLLQTAETRVTPPCRYAARCGGCDLQHLDVHEQRTHKRQVLIELLRRQSITPPEDIPILSGREGGYRRRARLGVKCDASGQVHLGFRARGSDQLVDIDDCHVLAPALAALLAPLRAQLEALEAPRQVGHLELLETEAAMPVVVVRQLRANAADATRWREFARARGVAVALRVGRESPTLEWLDTPPALATHIQAGSRSLSLAFEPGDFLQVNAEVNQQLIDTVRAWLAPTGDERLLDLFAGIGNFSLALALAVDVHSVTAVEGSNAMVERLADNARRNGLEVTALQVDLARVGASLATLLAEHDSVLLDPPREGAEALCRQLASGGAGRVLYVSCDPASLARDAVHLLEGGFSLTRLAVADMFPHTAHLESLALFERAKHPVRKGGEQ
ncbi:TRAM domain-containing protein [Salinicola avicenniae]|uniref:TRAM domain-containing protein n=1 Tax=Salinicola avicenniae TaxID=2916836 RepID=UPI002072FBD5|nr:MULTISPECIES: TRAM domain-containing protein [unclassified Salinicola]